jgi:DNA-binding NarL/FixJ family response regulator
VVKQKNPGEHFAGLVPDEVITAYVKLLEAGRIPKDEAAAFLGSSQLVDELVKWGMAHVVPHTAMSPPSFRASSPHLAMMGVLGIWQAKMAHQHQLVFDGYQRLLETQAVPVMTLDAVPHHLVTVLTEPDDVAQASIDIMNTARCDYMMLETLASEMPMTEDFPILGPAELCEQLRMRAIYDFSFAEHPDAPKLIGACTRRGEEARVSRDVPMKMKLADEIAVLMALTRTATNGALLITAPTITRAAHTLFEFQWAESTPYGQALPGGPLSETELAIFQMLAQGKDDETIGRYLQPQRSQKTVQRHVKDVADRLGVAPGSRFELGYKIASRGWLNGQ